MMLIIGVTAFGTIGILIILGFLFLSDGIKESENRIRSKIEEEKFTKEKEFKDFIRKNIAELQESFGRLDSLIKYEHKTTRKESQEIKTRLTKIRKDLNNFDLKKAQLKLEIKKADGMQGFAAYQVSSARSKKKVILLNVYASLAAAVEHGIPPRLVIMEDLMHEFGHILQEWLELNMTEKQVDKFIASYAKKYGTKSYEAFHGKQALDHKHKEVAKKK